MGKKSKTTQTRVERFSEALMTWMGSPSSIIVHTLLFLGVLSLTVFGFDFDEVSLGLTTVVSLEAIYLSLLIQMSVNKSRETIEEVEEDIEELGEDIGEIEENIDELGEDIGEISEDIDKIQEEEGKEAKNQRALDDIQAVLQRVLRDIETLKGGK